MKKKIKFKEDVTIPTSRYLDLIRRDKFLSALEAAGVDNWDGYDYAQEIYEENIDDEST